MEKQQPYKKHIPICKVCSPEKNNREDARVQICRSCIEGILPHEKTTTSKTAEEIVNECNKIGRNDWEYPRSVKGYIGIATTINAIKKGLVQILELITVQWPSDFYQTQKYIPFKFRNTKSTKRQYTKNTISIYNLCIEIIINYIINTKYHSLVDNQLKSEILFHCFQNYKNRFNPIHAIVIWDYYIDIPYDIMKYIFTFI